MKFFQNALCLCMIAFCSVAAFAQVKDIRSCSESVRGISEASLIGKTEQELSIMFCEVQPLDRSFDLLVSKNLHPYKVPSDHKLLRAGRDYIVFELDETNHVVKVHKVRG